MKKMNNKKGFTLAELLIVVAIIAVLVAISIPIFTAQLNKAKYAADEANARSIYSELVADYLANGGEQKITIEGGNVTEGAKKQITVNYAAVGGGTNVYNFSGIVGVNFTTGNATTYPKVELLECKAISASAVTFGEGTAGSN